ncbi:MAG: SpoIID/LytB domain-containing protein [Acidimicrobiia bacterium]
MRLFRILLLLLLATATTIQLPQTARADSPPSVVFEGHGWGHGVGLAQYGAQAMATEGYSSTEIVEHYYADTSVVPLSQAAPSWMVDDPTPLWVNLTSTPYSTAQTVSFATTGGSLTFCQQEPAWVGSMYETKNKGVYSEYVELLEQRLTTLGFAPGVVDGMFDVSTTAAVKAFQTSEGLGVDGIVGPNTKNALWSSDSSDRCVIETPLDGTPKKLTPSPDGTECMLEGAALPGDCFGSVRGLSMSTRLVIPQRKVRNDSSIELAHGVLRVRPDRSGGTGALEGIHVLVELSVDDYVKGIDEVPFSWHTEALEAQAIASRSYAAGIAKGRGPETGFSGSLKDTCWCHVWSNTYSQVYAGYYPEASSGRWKTAASDTASLVVRHPSAGLATTYFSSSSGGATEANEDAWGSVPVPYLRSVPDPWSLSSANPFANWEYVFSAATVAARVGLDQLTGVAVVDKNQSGSARKVRFVGLSGGVEISVEKSGGWVRSVFGLRSNHYAVSWGDASTPPAQSIEETAKPKFSDINGNTFEKDIAWAYETGVTRGCNPPDNTRFCPNDRVSRGQMAAFLTRFLDLPAATEDFFDDDNGSTFEDDINRLAAAGITRGCGNDGFCPGASVTREQMAAFLVRAFQLTENSHGGFDDVSQSNTFVDDIGRLATAGITVGCNPPANTRYCPRESVTRAQMTAFLHRASTR